MQLNLGKSFADYKAEILVKIDVLAGQQRLKYITDVPGQEIAYNAKLIDAQAYKTAGYPEDATPYLWVYTQAIASSVSPTIVADTIIAASTAATLPLAQIESARSTAKLAVNAGTTIAEIYTIFTLYSSNILLL